jgi:hypothetical protein
VGQTLARELALARELVLAVLREALGQPQGLVPALERAQGRVPRRAVVRALQELELPPAQELDLRRELVVLLRGQRPGAKISPRATRSFSIG